MPNETAWVCIAAIAIVGILAMAFIFRNQPNPETGVSYVYDDQNRLQSMIPTNNINHNVKLKPI